MKISIEAALSLILGKIFTKDEAGNPSREELLTILKTLKPSREALFSIVDKYPKLIEAIEESWETPRGSEYVEAYINKYKELIGETIEI